MTILLISFQQAHSSFMPKLFENPERPLKFSLQSNFEHINSIQSKYQKRSLFSASGTLQTNESLYQVVIRPRGNSRIDYCDNMKALRIQFSEGRPSFGELEGLSKKLKLVTHCNPNPDLIQPWVGMSPNEIVLAEFLRYRVANILLGENSFKVKMGNTDYFNQFGQKINSGKVLILEPVALLRRRVKGIKVKGDKRPIEKWEIWPELKDRPAWFQEKMVIHQRRYRKIKNLLRTKLSTFKALVDLHIPARVLRVSGDLTLRDNNEAFLTDEGLQFIPYDFDIDPQAWAGRAGGYTERDDEQWFKLYLEKYLKEFPIDSQEKQLAILYLKKRINVILSKIPKVHQYLNQSHFSAGKGNQPDNKGNPIILHIDSKQTQSRFLSGALLLT